MTPRICAVVPSYNHDRMVGEVVAGLRRLDLPVFVIDDGSEAAAAATLAALHDPAGGVTATRLPANGGKGRAVAEGFRLARAAGFSHAIQVDADGQHDLAAVPRMLELARRCPEAVIAGQATFDGSAPLGRRCGRWLTHVWVFVETMSFAIADSMCGFRVYPLAAACAVLDGGSVGMRMDFDTEILVRLCWRGAKVANVPVRVAYPPGNTSNFRLWRDNARITWMHTRLVCAMLARLLTGRTVRARRADAGAHWAALSELGAMIGIRCWLAAYRVLGRRGCLAVMAPVVAYFYATGGTRRRASRQFLARAFAANGIPRQPRWRDGLRHFMSFAARTLDSVIAWGGGMPPGAVVADDPAALAAFAADRRGGVLMVGHLGNIDVSRALLDKPTRARLLVLMHTRHAENYNRVLREIAPESAERVLQVTEIGPDTAILLREHVEAGGWAVIAADRTPVTGPRRVCQVPFLGEPAPFSQGPYILAALMSCPVWLLFCRKVDGRYRFFVEHFAERIVLPRGGRQAALDGYAARYAKRLQAHALADPYQWYNFYDFWAG